MSSINNSALDSLNPKDQGYFADHKMNESVHRILELIPENHHAEIASSLEHIKGLASRLTEEILKVKETQRSYNFSGYSERLTVLNVSAVQKILHENILHKNGIQTDL